MDEAPAYVTGHLILLKKLRKDQFLQNKQFFRSKKLIEIFVIFFFSYKYQFMDVYRIVSSEKNEIL